MFQKELLLVGKNYHASTNGDTLELKLNFSNKVKKFIPEGCTIVCEGGKITITGIDAACVEGFAALVRRIQPPERYRGTGIRYVGEKVTLRRY